MNIYQERWIPQPTPETQHFWAARGPVCTVPFASYMKRYGLTEEQLATIPTIQREWAAKNPRAYAKDPLTVKDVLESRMIAWPFRKLKCYLVTDGARAKRLTSSVSGVSRRVASCRSTPTEAA